jgi:hypothetical protein
MMTSFGVPRDPSILFWRLWGFDRTTAMNCVCETNQVVDNGNGYTRTQTHTHLCIERCREFGISSKGRSRCCLQFGHGRSSHRPPTGALAQFMTQTSIGFVHRRRSLRRQLTRAHRRCHDCAYSEMATQWMGEWRE